MDRRTDNMLVGNRGAWLAGHALFSFLSSFSFIFKIVLNWEGIVEGLRFDPADPVATALWPFQLD